jgi:hypothetical protein
MGYCILADQHALGRYDMELLCAGVQVELRIAEACQFGRLPYRPSQLGKDVPIQEVPGRRSSVDVPLVFREYGWTRLITPTTIVSLQFTGSSRLTGGACRIRSE